MTIICPSCGERQPLAEEAEMAAGETIHCESCRQTFTVGAEPAMASPGADRYYIRRQSGKVFGPFETQLIGTMIDNGRLSGNEGVSQDKQVWLPILSVPALASRFEQRSARASADDEDETRFDESAPGASRRLTSPKQVNPFDSPTQFSPEATTRSSPPGPHDLDTPASGSPNVHEEPTRALDDIALAAASRPRSSPSASPLPALSELPLPEPLEFEVSEIPGLTSEEDVPPSGLDPSASDRPELPVPKSHSGLGSASRPRSRSDLPELPVPKSRSGAQFTSPSQSSLPELPVPKSRSGLGSAPRPRSRSDLPELPLPKSHSGLGSAGAEAGSSSSGISELPALKAYAGSSEPTADLPELPIAKRPRQSGGGPEPPVISELPTPKRRDSHTARGDRPELPVRKGGPQARGVAELPVRKDGGGRGVPELPVSKDGPRQRDVPELPVSKESVPELPISKEAIPELPMPRGVADLPLPKIDPELPILADGLDLLGQDDYFPELPTPRFDDVHLPKVGEEGDRGYGLDDIDFDIAEESDFESALDLGLDDLVEDDGHDLTGIPLEEASTLELDEDFLPPPTAGFDGSTDMLADLEVDLGLPGPPVPAAPSDAVGPVGAPAARPAPKAAPRSAPPAVSAARPARAPTTRSKRPLVLVAMLLVALAVGGLWVTGVIGGGDDEEAAPLAQGQAPTGREPVVLGRSADLDLALLEPGGWGDYLAFIRQARTAVEARQGADLDAVARLVVAESLMRAQYGDDTPLTQDLDAQASSLDASDAPLHRLAQGARAAVDGNVEAATEALSSVRSGEYAAWAHLFLGLAEIERYRHALAAAASNVSPEAGDNGTEPGQGLADGTGSTADSQEAEGTGQAPAEPATVAAAVRPAAIPAPPPSLGTAGREQLQTAVQLDPELIPAYYFRGVEGVLRGDLEAARRALEEALERAPQHLPSLLELSEVLLEQGAFDEVSRRLALVADDAGQAAAPRERSRVHHLLGRVALVRRQYEPAAQELLAAFAADPSNSQAMLELSDLFYETGQFERAVTFLEEQTSPDADPAGVAVALARNRIGLAETAVDGTGDDQMATVVSELEASREAFPDDPRFPYLLGRVRRAQNLFDDAEAAYRSAIDIDEAYRPAYVRLAELAQLSNQNDAALEMLARAEAVGQPESTTDTEIGRAYRELGRPNAAAAAFRRAVEVDAFNTDARMELAAYNLDLGGQRNAEEALSQLEIVEAAGVDDADLHALVARAQYELGYLNQARERMNRVAELRPDNLEPAQLYLMGRINFDAGELAERAGDMDTAHEYYETARRNFNAAYVQGRDSAEARYWEARAMLALGDLDEAVPTFRRAIDQTLRAGEPRGEFHYWLGVSLEELGQFQQALEAYVLVDRYDLRWALGHPELFYRRGRLFVQSRRFRLAKRDLEWALILDRDDADAAAELAEINALEQNWDRSIALWLRSLAIQPDQPRAHYQLGVTYLRLDRLQEATHHLEIARDDGFGNAEPDVYRTLGYLYKDTRRNQEAVRELRRYLQSGAVAAGSDEEVEVMRQIERLGGEP